MIWGRPTNLWLGLTSAISGAVAATLILGFHTEPTVTGALAGVWQSVLGAFIALVGNQPPTVNDGDKVNVNTPTGQPNATVTVSASAQPTATVAVATATPDPEP